jgi:cytochrome c peroxidase
VVAFYNNRETMIAEGSIVPEVMANMNVDELGDLGLTEEEEAALVAFMKTLSDGYQP